jgi:hypothetical protein
MYLIVTAVPAFAGEGGFSAAPWIDDLRQIRAGMLDNYANFEWAVFEREVNLATLFDETERRLRDAGADGEAKAIIDRAMRSIGDGHLRVKWPAASPGDSGSSVATDVCGTPDYDARMRGLALGPYLSGYHALSNDVAPEFPAGWVEVGRRRIGVIRIGLFAVQGYPELCGSVRAGLGLAEHSPCNEACIDRLESAEYAVMSRDLALRVRALERLGAKVLLLDITGNGGGSEWAEAAARVVSPIKLRSERRAGVRGEHWARHWERLARELRQAAHSAAPADLAQLEDWARQADRAQADALTPCPALPFWTGHRPDCEWLAPAFYATGLLGEADAARLHQKPWGPLVFSPAQYDFEESVWHGALVVLVDGGTGSAAEEFTAVLQDNGAALVMGAPTAGAGCGHTDGGTPVTLTHSHGILELPDCVRIRRDGTNEVRGIEPDVLIGFRAMDGVRRKGLRVSTALERGVAAAQRLERK